MLKENTPGPSWDEAVTGFTVNHGEIPHGQIGIITETALDYPSRLPQGLRSGSPSKAHDDRFKCKLSKHGRVSSQSEYGMSQFHDAHLRPLCPYRLVLGGMTKM